MKTFTILRIQSARETVAFRQAYASTLRAAIAMSRDARQDPGLLRRRGGWTKFLREEFARVAGGAVVPGPFGSSLDLDSPIIFTIADIQDIRAKATTAARGRD